MHKIFRILLLLLVLSACFADDISQKDLEIISKSIKLYFLDFPTKNTWDQKENIPILDTDFKMNYRTIIREAAKKEPNFDGKYRIVGFGLGTGVQHFFILDLNTGKVYDGKQSENGIKYTNYSSLIIINPLEDILDSWGHEYEMIPGWEQTRYLKWENEKYKTLLVVNPFEEDIW